jgi:TolA-binding protein
MTRGATIALAIILAVVASSANAEDYLLYKPQKTRSGDIPPPGDGVLTKTIIIQEGDTLSSLSRRYSGRSSFFPQILLFNNIRNPDLIIAGRSLRVPLARRGTADEVTGRETAKKRAATGGYSKASARMRTPRYSPVGGIAGKRLFNRGVSLFMNGRYREAIDIFDGYLAAYPGSPQASEAALYRADCYMRLSNR